MSRMQKLQEELNRVMQDRTMAVSAGQLTEHKLQECQKGYDNMQKQLEQALSDAAVAAYDKCALLPDLLRLIQNLPGPSWDDTEHECVGIAGVRTLPLGAWP